VSKRPKKKPAKEAVQNRRAPTEAEIEVLRLSREDQMAFWQALQRPPAPTAAQRRLGRLIRSVM
jgi:hypothetical protein